MDICGCGAVGAGLALGTASILSVGPNNLMLIREGLKRGRVHVVASVVCGSDVALLVTAFLLTDAIPTKSAPVFSILVWLGLAALAWFAVSSFRAAFHSQAGRDLTQPDRESLQGCMRRVLRVVWLNPLTYIEFLLIPAAVCGTFHGIGPRMQFIFGLILMTTICCYGYGFGGHLCAALLRHRRTLQIFDLTSGVLLGVIAFGMAAGLLAPRP